MVCTSQFVRSEQIIIADDDSKYVRVVEVSEKDLSNVCSFNVFKDGFSTTYIDMWNARINFILKLNLRQDVILYYKDKLFSSKVKQEDSIEKASLRSNACDINSYQQGKILGFTYALDNLDEFQKKSPGADELKNLMEIEAAKEVDIPQYSDNKEVCIDLVDAKVRLFHSMYAEKKDADSAYLKIISNTKSPKLSQLRLIASKDSLDPGSKSSGGDMGYVLTSYFTSEFASAILSLPLKTLSSPIQSILGWHLVWVDEREDIGIDKRCSKS